MPGPTRPNGKRPGFRRRCGYSSFATNSLGRDDSWVVCRPRLAGLGFCGPRHAGGVRRGSRDSRRMDNSMRCWVVGESIESITRVGNTITLRGGRGVAVCGWRPTQIGIFVLVPASSSPFDPFSQPAGLTVLIAGNQITRPQEISFRWTSATTNPL